MADKHKKSGSLTVETKPATTKRPDVGERHKSDSNVGTRRSSAANPPPSNSRHSEPTGRRGSKASRADPSNATIRPSDRTQASQQSESRTRSQAANLDDLLPLTFVILGANGVGKSAFIRKAFDLKKPPTSPIVSSKVSLSGKMYQVQLIALPLEHLDFTTGRKVSWPKYLNSSPFPHVDGVFCLYNVADEETLSNFPQLLGTLTASEVPTTLVARNSDGSEDQRKSQSRFDSQIRRSFATVTIAEATNDQAEKRNILSMLKLVLASSPSQHTSRRPSAAGSRQPSHSVSRDTSPEKSRGRGPLHPQSQVPKSKDVLANSASRPPVIESADEQSDVEASDGDLVEMPAPPKTPLRIDTNKSAQASRRPAEPHTPISSTEDLAAKPHDSTSERAGLAVPETPESYYVRSMLRPNSAGTSDSRAFQTFLNMAEDDESPHEAHQADLDDSPKQTSGPDVQDSPKQEEGVPFQKLVERLLSLPASKQASKFVPAFLCLYRLFATPKQLLTTILEQFMAVEKSDQARFNKVAEMLRYLQVLGQWTAQYPGDFADPTTRGVATTFVQSLAKHREFGPAANQINNNLESVVPDDDADWAYTDAPRSASKTTKPDDRQTPGSSTTSSTTSIPSSANSVQRTRSKTLDGNEDDDPDRMERIILNSAKSSQSFLNLAQLSRAREESKSLRARPHIRLSKVHWHQFMDTPTEELAREITRIDWTLYSSIRPRDYVRHVSLSSQKRASRRQDNISQMVRQFNHLAIFVSGMILLRDKPKHRARALEKFMDLAWKVRQLNNYNSLGALVAGINGHEIARLAATRELVPAEKQKQFLRLTILTSVSRSHAAYRMAWENSSAERIPFLPLLRQDLTMASTANPTFMGSNINWKKFEIMGEAVVSVQRSLEQPYSFPRRSTASDLTIKLILETQILDEPEDSADPAGELYTRSIQYATMDVPLMSQSLRRMYRLAEPSHRPLRSLCRRPVARELHKAARIPAITSSQARHRPILRREHQNAPSFAPAAAANSRSIFIQTQNTPNPDALKFLPNHTVLPEDFPTAFVEYTSPRSTLAPPYPSQLAARLLAVDGVSSVFYGSDFITVTKAADVNWAHIKPEVFSLITEAISSGEQLVSVVNQSEDGGCVEEDSLAENEDDSEVVAMIKELLETRIRPAIQDDGGDIEFRGFENGMVNLKLRGACRTCDSSTVTLKNGIESMLMHYIEEVKGVNQVLDEEEEISMHEFVRFEEKLRQQKGVDSIPSTVGKNSLDYAE
ncbi:hypothetical protein DV735_g5471, partial [Chaetothyriales sp. CBS 134920]